MLNLDFHGRGWPQLGFFWVLLFYVREMGPKNKKKKEWKKEVQWSEVRTDILDNITTAWDKEVVFLAFFAHISDIITMLGTDGQLAGSSERP